MKCNFKRIANYDTRYRINESGEIFSIRSNKIIMQYVCRNGYKIVSLWDGKSGKTYRVHRLMAVAFLPNTYMKEMINHKNGIKTDNRLSNLEWVTRSENALHSYRIGTSSKKGELNCKAKLTKTDVRNIRDSRLSTTELMKIFNVARSTINRARKGDTWK